MAKRAKRKRKASPPTDPVPPPRFHPVPEPYLGMSLKPQPTHPVLKIFFAATGILFLGGLFGVIDLSPTPTYTCSSDEVIESLKHLVYSNPRASNREPTISNIRSRGRRRDDIDCSADVNNIFMNYSVRDLGGERYKISVRLRTRCVRTVCFS